MKYLAIIAALAAAPAVAQQAQPKEALEDYVNFYQMTSDAAKEKYLTLSECFTQTETAECERGKAEYIEELQELMRSASHMLVLCYMLEENDRTFDLDCDQFKKHALGFLQAEIAAKQTLLPS